MKGEQIPWEIMESKSDYIPNVVDDDILGDIFDDYVEGEHFEPPTRLQDSKESILDDPFDIFTDDWNEEDEKDLADLLTTSSENTKESEEKEQKEILEKSMGSLKYSSVKSLVQDQSALKTYLDKRSQAKSRQANKKRAQRGRRLKIKNAGSRFVRKEYRETKAVLKNEFRKRGGNREHPNKRRKRLARLRQENVKDKTIVPSNLEILSNKEETDETVKLNSRARRKAARKLRFGSDESKPKENAASRRRARRAALQSSVIRTEGLDLGRDEKECIESQTHFHGHNFINYANYDDIIEDFDEGAASCGKLKNLADLNGDGIMSIIRNSCNKLGEHGVWWYKLASSTISLFVNITQAKHCTSSMIGAITMYVNAITPNIELQELMVAHLGGAIIALITSRSYVWKSTIRTEGATAVLDDTKAVFSVIYNSEFLDALKEGILMLVSKKFFAKDTADHLRFLLGKTKHVELIDVIDWFFRIGSCITRFIDYLIYEGGSLNEYIFSKNPWIAMMKETDFLLSQKDRLSRGLAQPGKLSTEEFSKRCEKVLAAMKEMKPSLALRDPNIPVYEKKEALLETAYFEFQSQMSASTRVTPFCAVLVGTPGLGKGYLVTFLSKLWCRIRGIEYDPDLMFTRCNSSDYWDGYQPYSMPIIHLSEVGSESALIAKSKGSPITNELLSLADTQPFPLNYSDVNDKGKHFANPGLVVVDTNNANMNAEILNTAPAAVYRRFVYISVEVLDEFKAKHSSGIDPIKSLNQGGDLLDRYMFTITRRLPVNNQQYREEIIVQTTSKREFTITLAEYMKEHLERQETLDTGLMADNMDYYLERDLEPMPSEAEWKDLSEDEKEWNDDDIHTEALDLNGIYSKSIQFKDNITSRVSIKTNEYATKVSNKFKKVSSWKNDIIRQQRKNIFRLIIYFVLSYFLSLANYIKATLAFVSVQIILVSYAIGMSSHTTYWCLGVCLGLFVCLNLLQRYVLSEEQRLKIDHAYFFYCKRVITKGIGFFESNRGVKIALILGGIATAVTAYIYSKRKEDKPIVTEASLFEVASKYNDKLVAVEEKINASKAPVRFTTRDSIEVELSAFERPSFCNDDPEELFKAIRKNVVRVQVDWPDGSPRVSHAIGVRSQYILMNAHMIPEGDFDLHIYKGSVWNPSNEKVVKRILSCNVISLGNDRVLIRTIRTFSNIMNYFTDNLPRSFVGTFKGQVINANTHKDIRVVDSRVGELTFKDPYVYEFDHVSGDCGQPILAKVNSGSIVVGIHCAGQDNSRLSYCCKVTRSELENAIVNHEKVKNPNFNVVTESLNLPHPKSPFSYSSFSELDYIGSIPEVVQLNKGSKLQRSVLVDYLDDMLYDSFDFVRSEIYGRPIMYPRKVNGVRISPDEVFLNKMNSCGKDLDLSILSKCVSVFSDHIIQGLREEKVDSMAPIPVMEAFNGSEDDAYLRAMKTNTAAGFPYSGKKKDWIEITEVPIYVREPGENLKGDVLRRLELYAQGEMSGQVVVACSKDEARPMAKCLSGSTRKFLIVPVDVIVCGRILLAPVYTAMSAYSDRFCCALGIDPKSNGPVLFNYLNEFSTNIMEGDYSGYDINMPFDVGCAANEVVLNVLRAFGYNQEALTSAETYLMECLYPFVKMNNDIFLKPGYQPSGKYGTAEDNSLRGVLLLMYAWYSHPELKHLHFFQYCRPLVYGDDVLVAVKDEVKHLFNNVTYQAMVKDLYGMSFTSASKDSVVEPFLSIFECSFLKRRFVYSEERKSIECLLDLNSIYKSIEWYIPSPGMSAADQLYETCVSAVWEMFFHSKNEDHFIEIVNRLVYYLQQCGINREISDFPTYSDIYIRIYGTEEEGDQPIRTESLDKESLVRSLSDNLLTMSYHKVANFDEKELDLIEDPVRRHQFLEEWAAQLPPDYTLDALTYNSEFRKRLIYDKELRIIKRDLQELADLTQHLNAIKRKRRIGVLRTESLDMQIDNQKPESRTVQNLNIVDGFAEDDINLVDGSIMLDVGQYEDLELEEFLRRPVEIANFPLPIGSHTDEIIPVWDLLSLDPTVRSKLRNFSMLSAEVCVRVEISASPFHAAALVLSYQPYPLRNENLIRGLARVATQPSTRPLLINYLTQSKEVGLVDLKMNQPYCMRLPFISTKPAHRLYNSSTSALSDLTSYNDMAEAGSLFVYTINPVTDVSDSVASVPHVQVYAWFENVKLGVPTASQTVIRTESLDERKTGPVEKVASSLADAAEVLTRIPKIAPLALPANVAFKTVASVASWFGWSKPTIIQEPTIVKNQPLMNGANCIGMDTNLKLSVDPKQEVNVDPRIIGDEEDDLVISNIASRLSYLRSVTWSPSDPLMSSPIYNIGISPFLTTRDVSGIVDYYQPTACAFAVRPFAYWRCDMLVRVEVVCSNYHRGKLAIMYEPNVSQAAIITADVALNKNFMHILDLQSSQSVDLIISHAQPRAWMRSQGVSTVANLDGSTFNPTNLQEGYCNGFISILPFTTLQSPDNSSVEINIYVKAIDLQVAVPYEQGLPLIRTESAEASIECEQVVINPTSATLDNIHSYHFGEMIPSFRLMLKRYTTIRSETVAPGTSSDITLFVSQSNVPAIVPAYNAGLASRSNIFSYLRYAYVGLKGGTKFRIFVMNRGTPPAVMERVAVRLPLVSSSDVDSTSYGNAVPLSSFNGTASFIPDTNAGIEYEIPYYSPNLMSISFADDLVGDNTNNDMLEQWQRNHEIYVPIDGSTPSQFVIDMCGAEDFTFLRYQGAPYYSTS